MSRADELTWSAASQGARGPDASGRREGFLDSGPASSAPALVASCVVDSSGLAYFWCSYVEHSFPLLDTITAGWVRQSVISWFLFPLPKKPGFRILSGQWLRFTVA